MNILHLQYAGKTGGIEKLSKDIGLASKDDKNIFMFVHEGGVLCEEMKTAGLNVQEYSFDNRNILGLYRAINEMVDNYKIDAIVIHHPAPLIWIACLLYAKKKNRAKLIVYVHNCYAEITKFHWLRRSIYDLLLKKSDHIIAISKFVKSTVLESTKISDEKITVAYNGVDTKSYSIETKTSHDLPIKLIYVGRLIPEKGVQVLIEALSLLENKEDYVLDIVGDGYYKKELESMIDRLGLKSNVRLLGNQRDIPQRLHNADIFIHPAIWEEGFGITIVEAMSAGLVCIAFKKGAIPEIIDTDINGFIVEEDTPEALAAKIQELKEMFNTSKYGLIQKEAIIKSKKFTIEKLVERLHQIYENL